MQQEEGERIFIGFDCGYRTLGWCILTFNPERAARAMAETCDMREARGLFRLIAGGVEDVLGAPIADVAHPRRAQLLMETIARIIPRDIMSRATVIIEHQPRQQSVRGAGNVHGDNAAVEAQLIFYFSAIARAKCVYLIDPKKKDIISSALLKEPVGKTYAERKKQSRRAYCELAEVFDFSAHAEARDFKHLKADRSDACIQIFAAIFICAKSIEA